MFGQPSPPRSPEQKKIRVLLAFIIARLHSLQQRPPLDFNDARGSMKLSMVLPQFTALNGQVAPITEDQILEIAVLNPLTHEVTVVSFLALALMPDTSNESLQMRLQNLLTMLDMKATKQISLLDPQGLSNAMKQLKIKLAGQINAAVMDQVIARLASLKPGIYSQPIASLVIATVGLALQSISRVSAVADASLRIDRQIESMFRRYGVGNYEELLRTGLVELTRADLTPDVMKQVLAQSSLTSAARHPAATAANPQLLNESVFDRVSRTALGALAAFIILILALMLYDYNSRPR